MSGASEIPQIGRVAGIDYGTVRIGVAITDRQRRIASPLDNYQRQSEPADADYFRDLATSHEVALFVVGLPVHLSGRESEKSREAKDFAEWLGRVVEIPVVLFDERFTSVEAERHLIASGLSKKKRKQRLDKLAAQIMLSAYLDTSADYDSAAPLDD
ncbi:MAG: Holliday junction resolvase RuvX [Pirellulales bacterium]